MAAKSEKKNAASAKTEIKKKTTNRKNTAKKKATPIAAKKQPSVKKTATKTPSPTDVKKTETSVATPVQETGIWKNFIKCLKKYFVFSGRASRYEYFSFGLGFFFTSFITGFLGSFCGFLNTVSLICFLLLLIPMFAVLSRRLHDIGKNLWNGFFNWIVYGLGAAVIIGLIAFVFSDYPGKLAFFSAFRYVIMITALTVIIVSLRCLTFVCRRGQTTINQYGNAPALNHPATEKTAFWIIVLYLTLNIIVYILSMVVRYNYEQSLLQSALQTEAQFIASQDAINAVYAQKGTYTWLNNKSALDMRLVPADMPTPGGTGITSALGLPVSFFGFADSYVIAMEQVDKSGCIAIMQTPWRLMGLQAVQIRQQQRHTIALTDTAQCYICDDGKCTITWVLR